MRCGERGAGDRWPRFSLSGATLGSMLHANCASAGVW